MSDNTASGAGNTQLALPSGAQRRTGRELDASALIALIQAHRKMPRDKPGYWDEYCALIKILCRASAILFVRKDADGNWVLLGKDCAPNEWLIGVWSESIADIGERSMQKGFAFSPMQDDAKRLHILTMVRANGLADALLVMDIPERERAQLNELILRALLATDFPAGESGTATPAPPVTTIKEPEQRTDAGLLELLDLAAQVMNEQSFAAATLVLVNGLAAHYKSAQASLGWLKGESMRVVAVSHLDRFERNTQNIGLLEDAFFEILGEEAEVWFPVEEGNALALTSQEALRNALGFAEQCSVPLRDSAGTTGAVVFLGFQEPLIERPKISNLMIIMELLQPWLQDLKARDRWWGGRLATSIRGSLERFFGAGHVWRRTFALVGSVFLLLVLFGQWDYRIEAMSQLTTDSTRFISAQFDGRVEEVHATAGDVVKEGTVLAALDTRELRQQEMDIRAERQRLGAEADKARALGNLAESEIAQARSAQAEARLNRVLQYLAQARSIAPFDGVIVDGERKELLNAPVKKGDKLFRVARIEGLYVELLVPERDIRYVKPDAVGQLRLLSRPDQKISFKLSVFIPMAQVKGQEGNHFLIKAKLQQEPEDWWRPGMSGTALIDGGMQNIGWILTHRAIDTLRMKLWWLW